MKRRLVIILIFSLCFTISAPVLAEVRSSTNFMVESDSVNVGGKDLATSSNYSVEDTIGEQATGISTSTNYKISAGYRQLQPDYIAVSAPGSVTITPALPGLSGGTSNISVSTTVTTDSGSGYSLKINTDSSPALSSTSSAFNDYTPTTPSVPDYDFSINSNTSEFGYTLEGPHLKQNFLDDGSSCNTGSQDTSDKCWLNFTTTSEEVIKSFNSNHPNGTDHSLKLQAASGSNNIQTSDIYKADIIITVVPN